VQDAASIVVQSTIELPTDGSATVYRDDPLSIFLGGKGTMDVLADASIEDLISFGDAVIESVRMAEPKTVAACGSSAMAAVAMMKEGVVNMAKNMTTTIRTLPQFGEWLFAQIKVSLEDARIAFRVQVSRVQQTEKQHRHPIFLLPP
jgi:hypothetical protein